MDMRKVQSIFWDLAVIVGSASLVFGLHLAWRPLGYIVGGLLLMGVAGLNQYGAAREERGVHTRPEMRPE